MSYFDDTFPGVRAMLEADIAKREAQPHEPWCLLGLELGRYVILSSYETREQAEAALDAILQTCAPFIRDTFKIEHRRKP